MRRMGVVVAAVGSALLFTSCGFFGRLGEEPSGFASHFTGYPGTVTGVRFEDLRVNTISGHRYGFVRVRSMGLREGGFEVLKGYLGDQITNAFAADVGLEAVFVVFNADGFPPNQAAGYLREQVLGPAGRAEGR